MRELFRHDNGLILTRSHSFAALSDRDAAKAAQTSALFLLALGLYLVATVISTTDEDLLRGTAVQVSQLGVRAPVAIAYALAPTIFLFLHVHTLIRFDMLAANLRLLTADLDRAVPLAADRERCRALLANVEFVQVLAAPRGSSFRSPLLRFMAWLIVSALPVVVFLAVQISFLRYQSEAITTLHQVCLALDLGALFWFHTRLWLAGRERRAIPAGAYWSRMSLNAGLPLLILAFAAVYAGVPTAERTTVGTEAVSKAQVNVIEAYDRGGVTGAARAALKEAASQPLDLAACPWLGFGCRFLRLDHQTLLANSPPADVLVRLRTGTSDDLEKDLAHVEGLFLRGRTLRFADLTESRLYAADLVAADLRGTLLKQAQLQGTYLGGLSCRAPTSGRRSCRVQCWEKRSCRAQNSFRPSYMAQTWEGPSCRAPTSGRRSCRARTFVGRSCRARTFVGRSCSARTSERPGSGKPSSTQRQISASPISVTHPGDETTMTQRGLGRSSTRSRPATIGNETA